MTGTPIVGITCDCAHSQKKGITEYQAHDLRSGERIFYRNIDKYSYKIQKHCSKTSFIYINGLDNYICIQTFDE